MIDGITSMVNGMLMFVEKFFTYTAVPAVQDFISGIEEMIGNADLSQAVKNARFIEGSEYTG